MTATEWKTDLTADEIWEAAGRGTELHNLPPVEDALYARARLVYTLYKYGEMDNEGGAEQRRIAMARYEQSKARERFERRWIERSVELHKQVEGAAAAYVHAPGYKTADTLWEAVTMCQAKIQLDEAERGDFFES